MDTNVYRCLTFGKSIDEIRRDFSAIAGSEESKGYRSFMAPVPYIELFSHLADPEDAAREICLRTTVGCHAHTRRDLRFADGKLMPYWQLLAAQVLFGHRDPRGEKSLFSLDDMAGAIANAPTNGTLERNIDYLTQVKTFADKQKGFFKESFRERQTEFHSFLDKHKTSFRKLAKEGKNELIITCLYFILVSAADVAEVDLASLPDEEWRSGMVKVLELFAAPAFLHLYIMEKMIDNPDLNIEKSKWANLYWDYQLLFYINSSVPVILITADEAMINAADAAGVRDRIVSLKEYLELLKLNISFR